MRSCLLLKCIELNAVSSYPLQASHVGKVVVSTERLGDAPPAVQPRSRPSLAITGGSGQFGCSTIRKRPARSQPEAWAATSCQSPQRY